MAKKKDAVQPCALKGKLVVRVVDKEMKPVAGVGVKLGSAKPLVSDANGVADFGELFAGEYLLDMEFTEEQAKTYSFGPAMKAFVPKGGGLNRTVQLLDAHLVNPKMEIEQTVILFDKGLRAHQEKAETGLRPSPVAVELWLEPKESASAYDKPVLLKVEGSGKLLFFKKEDLTEVVDISKPFPVEELKKEKKLKLWVIGERAGACSLKLITARSETPRLNPEVFELKLGVVELKLTPHAWTDAEKPELKPMSDLAKVKGRFLHLQKEENHARAKIVLAKLDKDQWPEESDGYELVLSVPDEQKSIALFEKEEGGAALELPLKIAKKDLLAAEKIYWVEGTEVSKALRDARLEFGVQAPKAEKFKTRADWARFSVLEIEKVAPVPHFDTPSADYDADKLQIFVNLEMGDDKRKIKIKAKLNQKLKDVPLHFMLAADKDNGLKANTGKDVPAALKKTDGTAWTWKDIDESFQKKDKKKKEDHFHISALTNAEGVAQAELELSTVGGDVFRAGAYIHEDHHLALYDASDEKLGKRKPILSKSITVMRKLWYQRLQADTCAAPRPTSAERAFENIKAPLIASTAQTFQKSDLPANIAKVTFYPEWMVKEGGGDKDVAVVGAHNWAHFRNNESKFFPADPTEKSTLKAKVLVVDYQWDPDGYSDQVEVALSAPSEEIDIGRVVVTPPLQGALVQTGLWRATNSSTGALVSEGQLTEANILIEKTRTSTSHVKVELPQEAQEKLNEPDVEVKVILSLATSEDYLGESRGSHILAVFNPSDVSDYNDTIAHEIGHSVNQTPGPNAQPKGLPEHLWWNTDMGTHCANPTTPTVRNTVEYPQGQSAARQIATCIMFEAGPVPSASNCFCDHCHHYLLAQDMKSF